MATNQSSDKFIQVRLITPEGVEFDQEIAMVVIPGFEGVFGALPRHAPMVAYLGSGEVKLYFDDRHKETPDKLIKVNNGFAEITPKICTILADQATI